jgi:hypothetical protein
VQFNQSAACSNLVLNYNFADTSILALSIFGPDRGLFALGSNNDRATSTQSAR